MKLFSSAILVNFAILLVGCNAPTPEEKPVDVAVQEKVISSLSSKYGLDVFDDINQWRRLPERDYQFFNSLHISDSDHHKVYGLIAGILDDVYATKPVQGRSRLSSGNQLASISYNDLGDKVFIDFFVKEEADHVQVVIIQRGIPIKNL